MPPVKYSVLYPQLVIFERSIISPITPWSRLEHTRSLDLPCNHAPRSHIGRNRRKDNKEKGQRSFINAMSLHTIQVLAKKTCKINHLKKHSTSKRTDNPNDSSAQFLDVQSSVPAAPLNKPYSKFNPAQRQRLILGDHANLEL